MNKWKDIWNKRHADELLLQSLDDPKEIWKELKRIDGFDVDLGKAREEYYNEFYKIWEKECSLLDEYVGIWNSVFEVGCGAGATLYLFAQKNKKVSGVDYSTQSIEIAKKVLENTDIACMEANAISTDERYDIVMADSVFAYFPDEEYTLCVLTKMHEKASKAVFITEVFDKQLEEVCMKYRKAQIENYDQRYKDLDKLFISRSFFELFAIQNNCEIVFTAVDNPYYWNSPYMYNVLLIKK